MWWRFRLTLGVVVYDKALLACHWVEDIIHAGSSRNLSHNRLICLLRLLIIVSVASSNLWLTIRLLLTHTAKLHVLLRRRYFKQLLLERHLLLSKVLLCSQKLSGFLLFVLVLEIVSELKLWGSKDLRKSIHLTISSHAVALLILVVGKASTHGCLRSTMLVSVGLGRSLAIVPETVRLLKLRGWGRARIQWRLWCSPQPCQEVRTACSRSRAGIRLLPRFCGDA